MRAFPPSAVPLTLAIAVSAAAPQEPLYILARSTQPGMTGAYLLDPWRSALHRLTNSLPLNAMMMEWLPGNRHILILGYNPGIFSLYLLERDTGVQLAFPLPPAPAAFYPTDVLVDQEGDVLFTNEHRGGSGLYRLDPAGVPVRWLPWLTNEVAVDLDSGDFVGKISSSTSLVRVSPSGQMTTLTGGLGTCGDRIAQDPGTGDFLLWDCGTVGPPRNLLRITPSGVVTATATVSLAHGTIQVFPDPAPGGEFVFFSINTVAPGFYTLSRTGGRVSPLFVVPTLPPPTGGPFWHPIDFRRDRPRKLSTVTSGIRNSWNLFIDFPGDGGLGYVVLVGASGIRPGVPLPDGRVIRLNPDTVTLRALAGQLPGFSGLSDTLDSRGTSMGTMDANWLPPPARGRAFWAVGLTLDPNAPSGIRTVSDPIVVQIR